MAKTGKILAVDDDEYIGLSLKLLLDEHFEAVTTVQNPELIPELMEQQYDVVLLDMNFRQGDTDGEAGLRWLKYLGEHHPEASVLMLTAYGEVGLAVSAMKAGALDFIVKPWQNDKLLATVRTAYQLSRERKKVQKLSMREQLAMMNRQPNQMIGEAPAMQRVFRMMEKVAATDANILILGENGTGKEVAARTIHQMSQRHNSGFVHVDLGAITETLFESELFGHRKGAFTDAREDRVGRIEAADGGTLFLDEIGNVPIRMQPKLLTVLQQRKLIRLGSNEPRNFDVRLITATNLDMAEAVKEGKFRQDLLYRINTVEIVLPPLRERMEDLPILLEDMIQRFGNQYHKPLAAPSANVLQLLRKYHWPGNIRELQHAVERAVIMAEGDRLVPEDFEFLLHKTDDFPGSNDYNLEHLEAWAIEKAIRKHQGNISHAAAELGLSRGAMYRRMEKYGIQP